MLFQKQNKLNIDARYFLKETVLNEAPTEQQVKKLTSALKKLFGSNCSMGQGSSGANSYVSFKDEKGQWHNFLPMSGAYSKEKTQPASFRKASDTAEEAAYILLQNAEQMQSVMMPVIKKIFSLSGDSVEKSDTEFHTNKVPSALDNQEELAKLKKENEELKKKIAELEKKLSNKGRTPDNTSAPKNKSKWTSTDLEIDE